MKNFVKSFSRRFGRGARAAREIELLRKSSLLDPYWYRQSYADLRDTPIDVARHYFECGAREGRNPSPFFDTSFYVAQNADVFASGMNPLVHYIVHGAKEGRDPVPPSQATQNGLDRTAAASRGVPSPADRASHAEIAAVIAEEFDADFYLREYSDVKSAHLDPLKHFIEHGWREGRDPNALFWTHYYLGKNPEVAAAGINPFFHFLAFGRREGLRPNPIGRELWGRPAPPSDADWRSVASARAGSDVELVVIMPVYKGFADTLAAIHSVLDARQRTRFELLVINDRGPEPTLNAELRALAERGLFTYLENDENLGFSGTINRGLALRSDLDVILLNADTLVFGDWIDRLRAHGRSHARVATVTPLSNNATICSYPDINKNNLIALEASPAELDAFARECNRGRRSIVPTGVGFCFYMRRDAIDEVGAFDAAAFPRGYGEENDFCMRALKAGFRNVFAHDVFVFHSGRVSFADIAAATYGPGQDALVRKHPDYPLRVQRYFRADPAREARMRLDLFRLARELGRNSAVQVTHAWSGGIETHVRDLAARLEAEHVKVLQMTVGDRDGLNVTFATRELDIHLPSLGPISLNKFPDLISDFLGWLRPKILHVHSLATLDWRGASQLMAIFRDAGIAYDCTLHDFATICHRNHMVTSEGLFCGQPEIEVCRACIRADPECVDFVDPAVRRETYGAFLRGAAHVFVPSEDTASRLGRAFPGLEFAVRPHEDDPAGAHWPTPPAEPPATLRVAAIGAIGAHKGSGVLHDLAVDARERSLPIEFTIVGYSDMNAELERLGVALTGRYKSDAEALRRIEELRPDVVLIPSIWPETYCYTLSLALAAGVPPVVFDIGAPADRLRELGTGAILDLSLAHDPARLNDALLRLPVAELWRKRRKMKPTRYDSVIEDYYGRSGSQIDRTEKSAVLVPETLSAQQIPTRVQMAKS